MTQIIELQGTEKRLYQLVAPLVMNPEVLKQNYNYPFRTSESFVWFVAVDGKEVVMQVKVGDKVIYSKYAGTDVELEGEKYIIVKQNDILAIVE